MPANRHMASFRCGLASNAWQHRIGISPHSAGFGSLAGAITPAARFLKNSLRLFPHPQPKRNSLSQDFLIFSRFFAGNMSLCAQYRIAEKGGVKGDWSSLRAVLEAGRIRGRRRGAGCDRKMLSGPSGAERAQKRATCWPRLALGDAG